MKKEILTAYESWMQNAVMDGDLASELRAMNESTIEDAFYRDLEFGTGGLRGVIGAGTNRMNVYTVAKASKGLAEYVCENFPQEKRAIAVSYDSRIKSDLFARVAAGVFAASGIKVYIYDTLMPTPCLSYAVRALDCAAGVMVTASHNPSVYNGYKVYGSDGCQITNEAADAILAMIEKQDVFAVEIADFDKCMAEGRIAYIPEKVYDDFISSVRALSMLGDSPVDRDVKIVYTPLNGTGLRPVTRILKESGFTNVFVVKEQEQPDGNFPTCPYPNPEIREALQLGLDYAKEVDAELLLATDPDCDRAGIAVKGADGEHHLLTGNEVGMLLTDYICARRIAMGKMPEDPVLIKTIVTIDMADRIAADYGVRTINVLTGFKFIGEQIGLLEKQGKASSYLLGFEESYGYMSGTHVRDKDAVNAAMLICEMFAYYKAQGMTLIDRLEQLYAKYGYCLNTLHNYAFKGASGMTRMNEIMDSFRKGIASFGGKPVEKLLDYKPGLDDLPPSNVLKFLLEGHCSATLRPSGTEPKLKLYISVSAPDREQAAAQCEKIRADIEKIINA